MKKILFFLIAALVVVIVGCQKDDAVMHQNGINEDINVFMSRPEQPEQRVAVANHQVFVFLEESINFLIWTDDPPTPVNWYLTGPENDEWENIDQIMVSISTPGTYNLQVISLGVDWNITIILDPEGDQQEQVGARFVGSEMEDDIIYYTFRIKKPVHFSPLETLIRINELASDPDAPYLPHLDGVSYTPDLDSIDIRFGYPPSGHNFIEVKFNSGRIYNDEPVWLNVDPLDPYKCTEDLPGLDDIFHAKLKNGIAAPVTESFFTPEGVASPALGDYDEDIPVITMLVDQGSQLLNIWFFSQNTSSDLIIRHSEEMEEDWVEQPVSHLGGGHFHITLPSNPDSGVYFIEYGREIGGIFVQDEMVEKSITYNENYGVIVLHM
jgi:hypothetical protein